MSPQIYAGLYEHRALAFQNRPMPITPEMIIQVVCDYFKVTTTDLTDYNRKREKVEARQIAMWLFIKETRWTLTKIGKEFGGRDHSTVIYAKDTVNDLMDTNKVFKAKVEDVVELLKN